jgi:hypothetical protein
MIAMQLAQFSKKNLSGKSLHWLTKPNPQLALKLLETSEGVCLGLSLRDFGGICLGVCSGFWGNQEAVCPANVDFEVVVTAI